jgi:hypothetical protein
MISTLIQLHTEHVMEEVIKPKGAITWFPCDEKTPPIEDFGRSEYILLCQQRTGYICKGRYYEGDVRRFIPNTANWVPTHWAFLNLPEKS